MTRRFLYFSVAALLAFACASIAFAHPSTMLGVPRAAAEGQGRGAGAPGGAAAGDVPTPRMPDGHPDLSGVWGAGGGGAGGGPPVDDDGRGNLSGVFSFPGGAPEPRQGGQYTQPA